jgi:hypothetical protein
MRRITVALSVTALIGCGTAQKTPEVAADPPKKEERTDQGGTGGRVAKGAVGGAAFGALMCLGIAPAGLPVGGVGAIGSVLASLVCLPFGLVAGAVTGGTVAAVKSPPPPPATPERRGGLQRSFTYAGRFGHGAVLHSVEHAPAIVVERPGPVLSSAMRTVCDAGPWWNTPAQLYGQ